jgi:hypothetical protein
MQNMTSTKISSFAFGKRMLTGVAATAAALAAVGCGVGSMGTTAGTTTTTALKMQGSVMGGQQPVSGATIQLYSANQLGYGQGATTLISSAVNSDANGNFNITGTYTCPYSTSQVYLLATGGNSGNGTNANISMMAPLGSCGNLSASTFIVINELTTVAGAYALSGFMSSPTQMSTSPTNVTGLANAFATVNKLVNVSIGQTIKTTLPSTAVAPVALLNTLADILAACINTNGVGGSSTNCANLFAYATPSGGTAPTDTLTAALDIAKNPANNAATLYSLVSSTSPFQPTLTAAPAAYTMSIKYAPTGGFSSPSASAVDASGNLWVTNSGNASVTILNATTSAPTVLTSGSLSGPSAIAFDAVGNAWVTNKTSSSLSVFTPAGSGSVASTGTLSSPTGVAIDGQGTIWVTNSGNAKVSAVSVSGTSVTGVNSYSLGGTSPAAIAINPR